MPEDSVATTVRSRGVVGDRSRRTPGAVMMAMRTGSLLGVVLTAAACGGAGSTAADGGADAADGGRRSHDAARDAPEVDAAPSATCDAAELARGCVSGP